VVKGYGYFSGETTGLLRRFGCEVRILRAQAHSVTARSLANDEPLQQPAGNCPRLDEVRSVVKFTVTSWRACSFGPGFEPSAVFVVP
jgi:hypothetical protein